MGQIAVRMYTFFQNSKLEGAYMLLFALSIVILFVTDREKNRFHIDYSVILMFGVVCNPITIWILSLVFPALRNYEQMTVLIPLLLYIPYGVTELVYSIKSVKTGRVVAVLLLLYIAICGNFFGSFKGNTMTEANLYDADKRQIVEYLKDNARGPVAADEGILPFITAYGDDVPLLYGHDIMLFYSDLGIMDSYSEEVIELHNMMWEPEKHMPDIAKVAKDCGCDIIVVKNYEGAPGYADIYRSALVTDDYIVYRSVS